MNVSLVAFTVYADSFKDNIANTDKVVERCGRVCYATGDKMHMEKTDSFIHALIEKGHESVLEHASITFLVSGVSRSLTHQAVRHRLASYSQKSQRYVREDNFKCVVPESIRSNPKALAEYECTLDNIKHTYLDLLNKYNIKAEDARFVLPNACETEIAVTMNFRELRHFLRLRLDPHAQWEIRDMAMEMLRLAYNVAPYSFEDLYTQHCKGLDIAVGRV